jgi:hypothetical protein
VRALAGAELMVRTVAAFFAAFVFLPSAALSESALDVPALLNGDWKIVDQEKPEQSQSCDKMQRFAVSPDGKSVLLTEPWANFSANYKIILIEQNRMLTILDGDERMTEQGDPILWWLYFEDKDSFRFRQYGWPAQNRTFKKWVRC